MFQSVFAPFFSCVLGIAVAPHIAIAFGFVFALNSLNPFWGAGASVTIPSAIAGGAAPALRQSSQASDGKRDEEVVARHREAAHRGDPAAIDAIVRLAGGSYINSAEGGESLNALFMDLLIAHPVAFLSAVARQSDAVRDRVIRELRQPVHDAYFAGDLLAAVRFARRRDPDMPFVAMLEDDYVKLHAQEVEAHRWLRDDLVGAADACLQRGTEGAGDDERAPDIVGGDDRDCDEAVAMARDRLSTSPHDPVVGAIAIDLAGYLGRVSVGDIFRDENFRRWSCAGAAFYHRAMAQYGRYGERSRGYLAEVCTKAATALPLE